MSLLTKRSLTTSTINTTTSRSSTLVGHGPDFQEPNPHNHLDRHHPDSKSSDDKDDPFSFTDTPPISSITYPPFPHTHSQGQNTHPLEFQISNLFTIRNTTLTSIPIPIPSHSPSSSTNTNTNPTPIIYTIETPHTLSTCRTSKITKTQGSKKDLIATIEWKIVDLPKVRWVGSIIDDGTGCTWGIGKGAGRDSEAFLRRGSWNKMSWVEMNHDEMNSERWSLITNMYL